MMMMVNSVDNIWGTTTVAVGDTAVLHCSFDALFQQLPHGNVRNASISLISICTTNNYIPSSSSSCSRSWQGPLHHSCAMATKIGSITSRACSSVVTNLIDPSVVCSTRTTLPVPTRQATK